MYFLVTQKKMADKVLVHRRSDEIFGHLGLLVTDTERKAGGQAVPCSKVVRVEYFDQSKVAIFIATCMGIRYYYVRLDGSRWVLASVCE